MNQTLKWLYSAENKTGGIAAWYGPQGWHRSYPEVTGYLLPTLWKWGACDLAERCAEWLAEIQNDDGSWNGLDDVKRPFDTAAIIEGLRCIDGYQASVERAEMWMLTQITDEGYLKNSPSNPQPEIYNLRASAIIGNRYELQYWHDKDLIGNRQRAHYLAYAVEGALNMDDIKIASDYAGLAFCSNKKLMPFYVDNKWHSPFEDYDFCATAQWSIIFNRLGMDATKHYNVLREHIHPSGGVPQSTADEREIAWGAKFYLDLCEVME